MIHSRLRIALLASALFLSAAAPPEQRATPPGTSTAAKPAPEASEAEPVDWRAATREDVLAAYDIFSRHHPGMFDPHNPGFPNQLSRARDAAMAMAGTVDDAEGHMRALGLFSAILADDHARIAVGYDNHEDVLSPGFRTVWRGNALHVLDPVGHGPPQGSELLGCDGKSASDLVREALFLNGYRPAEAGQWWEGAFLTFLRVRSPYEKLPRQCSFRHPDGQTASISLDWRPVPEEVIKQWFGAESERDPVGLTQPRPGIFLITLSTFAPDEQGRARYARLFNDIEQQISRIAAGRAVVIDLRHNRGGNSSWSDELARKLWGEAAVEDRLAHYFQNTQIWWLADQENIAHWQELAARARAEGRAPVIDGIDYVELSSKLELAMKRGKHFYIEDYGASLAAEATGAQPRQLPPVYVVTDGGCLSACLDALDLFTRFSGVKLVGAPTSADSNYLDIRFQQLPSGRGAVVLPTKIWVGRPRRAGQVYWPDIPVNDLRWSTAAILDHIERDLVKR